MVPRQAFHHKRRKAMDEATKRKMLDILKSFGVTRVQAHFNGCGDEGQIESLKIRGIADAKKLDASEEAIALTGKSYHHLNGHTLEDFIEWLVYELLEDCGNWVDNEGGFGDITIIPGDHYIFVDFNYRETASVYAPTDLSLPDCTREVTAPILDKAAWMSWAEKFAEGHPDKALAFLNRRANLLSYECVNG
jgi:hypothetical protein